MRKWAIAAIVVVVLGVATGVGLFSVKQWYQNQLLATPRIESKTVEIPEGSSTAEIADLLASENIIKNARAFRLYLRQEGIGGQLQAGTYRFAPALTAQEVAMMMADGETATRRVTITGGMSLIDVTSRLEESGFAAFDIAQALGKTYQYPVLADKPAEASLEGYLFPDTYEYQIGDRAEVVVDKMLRRMDEKVTAALESQWATQGLNIHQGVTLASIVQKELSVPVEQQQAAQVFLRRLSLEMRLESDPTFMYAARQLGVESSVDVPSPYNTYEFAGLPPGPISNPGLSAMEAVANPSDTAFLYFVTGADGVTRFSGSLDEHNALINQHGVAGQE